MIDKKKARQDSYVLKNMKREPRIHQMVRHPHIVVLLEVKKQQIFTHIWGRRLHQQCVFSCICCCRKSYMLLNTHSHTINTHGYLCVSDFRDGEQLLHGHGALCWRRPDGQDLWEEEAGGEGGAALHPTDSLCSGTPAQTRHCTQVRLHTHKHTELLNLLLLSIEVFSSV